MLSGRPIWCTVYLKLTSTQRYISVSQYITSFNFKTLFWLVLSWHDVPWIEVCSDIFISTYLYALSNSSHSASCCSNMPCSVWTMAVIPAFLTTYVTSLKVTVGIVPQLGHNSFFLIHHSLIPTNNTTQYEILSSLQTQWYHTLWQQQWNPIVPVLPSYQPILLLIPYLLLT
jgi:hypothetical protein